MVSLFVVDTTYKLEKAMATHSSTFTWKIPWMEEPGRLQSMGSLRVGHNWETSLSLFSFMHWRRKWQPTPVFLPGESQGRWSLVGCCLWGRTESARLKRLSSSSEAIKTRTPISPDSWWCPKSRWSEHLQMSLFLVLQGKTSLHSHLVVLPVFVQSMWKTDRMSS